MVLMILSRHDSVLISFSHCLGGGWPECEVEPLDNPRIAPIAANLSTIPKNSRSFAQFADHSFSAFIRVIRTTV
jgi:hypothetical protein